MQWSACVILRKRDRMIDTCRRYQCRLCLHEIIPLRSMRKSALSLRFVPRNDKNFVFKVKSHRSRNPQLGTTVVIKLHRRDKPREGCLFERRRFCLLFSPEKSRRNHLVIYANFSRIFSSSRSTSARYLRIRSSSNSSLWFILCSSLRWLSSSSIYTC